MMCITLSTTQAHVWCGPLRDAIRNRSRAGDLVGDVVGDLQVEDARQVVDRVGAQRPRAAPMSSSRLGVELVEAQEAVDVGVVAEVRAGASR